MPVRKLCKIRRIYYKVQQIKVVFFYFNFHHSKTIGAKKRKAKSNFDDILMIYSLTSDHNKYACTTNHYEGEHLLIMWNNILRDRFSNNFDILQENKY